MCLLPFSSTLSHSAIWVPVYIMEHICLAVLFLEAEVWWPFWEVNLSLLWLFFFFFPFRFWQGIQERIPNAMQPSFWRSSYCNVKGVALTRQVVAVKQLGHPLTGQLPIALDTYIFFYPHRLYLFLWRRLWRGWLVRWRPANWGPCACRCPLLPSTIAPRSCWIHWRTYASPTTQNQLPTTSSHSGWRMSTASWGQTALTLWSLLTNLSQDVLDI